MVGPLKSNGGIAIYGHRPVEMCFNKKYPLLKCVSIRDDAEKTPKGIFILKFFEVNHLENQIRIFLFILETVVEDVNFLLASA